MTINKIGISIIHHKKSDTWYQIVSQCTFYSKNHAAIYDLTRLEIKEAETEILFEKLHMKEYLTFGDIVYYGCKNIRKVKNIEKQLLDNLKKQNEQKADS